MGFQGMFPRVSPRLLEERQAQKVVSFKLTSGELRPYMRTVFEENVALAGYSVGTIFRWKIGDQSYWFRHPEGTDVLDGPVIGDVWQRVYFSGDDRYEGPRYTMTPQAYTDGDQYPVTSYRLGVPAPGTAIDATPVDEGSVEIQSISSTRPIRVTTTQPHKFRDNQIVRFEITAQEPDDEAETPETNLATYLNTGDYQVLLVSAHEFDLAYTDGQNVNYTDFISGTVSAHHDPALQERRFYTHTYVTKFGEEGPPAEPSPAIDVGRMQPVDLVLPAPNPSDTQGRLLEKRRIYRSNTGTEGAAYRLVEELPLADTEYTDDALSGDLFEPLESVEWDPPPQGLKGLSVLPGGIFVGFENDSILFSEPYRPHAWPRSYSLPFGHEVVAIGVFDIHAVVGTRGFPYLVTGTDPRSMSVRRLEVTQACVSKQSMVSMGYGCVYASADGLVFVSASGAELVTRNHLRADEWSRYHPHTIRAFEYEGRYIGFYDGGSGSRGGFVFDPREPAIGLTELNFWAKGGFRDPESEYLYLLQSNNDIVLWDASETPMTGTWKSKVVHTAYPVNFGAARVIANSYSNLKFRIYADGDLILEHAVTDREPFMLPSGYTGMDWEVEVVGTDAVAEITFGETPEEVAS